MKTMLILSVPCFFLAITVFAPSNDTNANENSAASHALVPVEDDMHEFMEYAFQPFFKDLKNALREPPKDGKAWKPVKANSLVLAEGGNLLMIRAPKEDAGKWNQHAAAVREHGGELYRAGKNRNYDVAVQNFKTLIKHCNACHQDFADGKHQLKP